jgi:hypothetical protein
MYKYGEAMLVEGKLGCGGDFWGFFPLSVIPFIDMCNLSNLWSSRASSLEVRSVKCEVCSKCG